MKSSSLALNCQYCHVDLIEPCFLRHHSPRPYKFSEACLQTQCLSWDHAYCSANERHGAHYFSPTQCSYFVSNELMPLYWSYCLLLIFKPFLACSLFLASNKVLVFVQVGDGVVAMPDLPPIRTGRIPSADGSGERKGCHKRVDNLITGDQCHAAEGQDLLCLTQSKSTKHCQLFTGTLSIAVYWHLSSNVRISKLAWGERLVRDWEILQFLCEWMATCKALWGSQEQLMRAMRTYGSKLPKLVLLSWLFYFLLNASE